MTISKESTAMSRFAARILNEMFDKNPHLKNPFRTARFRYYEAKSARRDVMFCWSTERVNGKFAAYDMVKGSGGDNWTMDEQSVVWFTKRAIAKQRALDRYVAFVCKNQELNQKKFNRLVRCDLIQLSEEREHDQH